MSTKRDRAAAYINQVLDMPAESSGQLPRIIITGTRELLLENHRGILTYEPSLVRVAYRGGNLEVRGKQLTLPTINPDELEIAGEIVSISFQSL